MKRLLLVLLPISLFVFSCEEESSCNDSLTDELKAFADLHWSLENWVTNHFNYPSQMYNGRSWNQFVALTKVSGTYDLQLTISGQLSQQLGFNQVSSDSLDTNPAWAFSDDVEILKDSLFYVKISSYDQFLGGWSDASSDWYWEYEDVGDTLEIIIKTPKKQEYIELFPVCN